RRKANSVTAGRLWSMSDGSAGHLAWTETDPLDSRLASVIAPLAEEDAPAADSDRWPRSLWGLLDDLGAPRWTLPQELGRASCPRPRLVQRYAQLAGGSLTSVFILSQHDAAIRRLLAAPRGFATDRWLGAVVKDRIVATVGISHLTTSRRLGAGALKVSE